MKNKILGYIGVGFFVLILLGSLFVGFGGMTGKTVEEEDDLSYYRSEEIPEDCRLPDYDNDVNKWKEHLGHHENTLYCLDYYK